jgi:hypothetical protein
MGEAHYLDEGRVKVLPSVSAFRVVRIRESRSRVPLSILAGGVGKEAG